MRQTYTVDHLVYEFQITSGNEVKLAIIGGASPTFQPVIDPFDWEAVPSITADINASRYPIRVLRESWRYLVGWVGSQRPSHFVFAALTERRCQLYHRVARRLVERFPYQFVETNGSFYFYRLKFPSQG